MPVLEDILGWSAARPAWQRDALRRIVTLEGLGEWDVDELRRICLAQRDVEDPKNPAPDPIPLAAEHLPTSRGPVERVQLIGIRDVRGVNALAPGQHMSFEPGATTIVFGYNGSGKSGYARILRQLCRARHRGKSILPNAFTEDKQPTPSATIDYRVAGSDCSETWQQGQAPPADLGKVSFFDEACAAVHVNAENELAFTPFGLDVLPKLVDICRDLNRDIRRLIAEQEGSQRASLMNPEAVEGTKVRTMLDDLDENTDIQAFRRPAELSDEDHQRIAELREALGPDPAAKARGLRSSIVRLQHLQHKIQAIQTALSPQAVEDVRVKLQDAVTKEAVARTAAEKAFGSQPLSGVGEEVWQELWSAARRYSQQKAYPGQVFPVTGKDARCVLCHQPLEADAGERLSAFEEFIQTDTQKAADRAQTELCEALGRVRRLTIDRSAYMGCFADIPGERQELNHAIRSYCVLARWERRGILHAGEKKVWTAPAPVPADPTRELRASITGLERRAAELDRMATGKERQKLINEQNELAARRWMGQVLDDVKAEISRKKMLAALQAALSDTVTTGITRKSSELTDTYVTKVLCRTFEEEVHSLGADYLRIRMDSPRGRYGEKHFKVSLEGAADGTIVGHILSDGEFRCIALAGFLAQLSTEQSGSALVFDDPIRSLDHQWRRKVALRLAQLATDRQVVVFTHDIVFLADLVGYCEERNVPVTQSYLRRGPSGPGECMDGVPWGAMKVKDRVGRLKNLLQAAEALDRREGYVAYEPEARHIYGLLRETWERAVEEVLLNGVVVRYDHTIHTQQLGTVSDITEDDIRMVKKGMTKSSRFLEGHDEAAAVSDSVPGPEELRLDIQELESWVTAVRQRR